MMKPSAAKILSLADGAVSANLPGVMLSTYFGAAGQLMRPKNWKMAH